MKMKNKIPRKVIIEISGKPQPVFLWCKGKSKYIPQRLIEDNVKDLNQLIFINAQEQYG